MKKAELIDELVATREELEELLTAMTSEQMLAAGVVGDWSVKDVLAHLLWYEREELELIRESGVVASPL
ncbi:MAG: DinB family protein, partial [Acidimicrobiaceae bacterium]|nr:DinB family protein [Acidimicrobiaceae bacterium]